MWKFIAFSVRTYGVCVCVCLLKMANGEHCHPLPLSHLDERCTSKSRQILIHKQQKFADHVVLLVRIGMFYTCCFYCLLPTGLICLAAYSPYLPRQYVRFVDFLIYKKTYTMTNNNQNKFIIFYTCHDRLPQIDAIANRVDKYAEKYRGV